MVRGFRLINEKGQSYSLMDIENYCLLTDPDGLGYSYSTEYEQIGNSFITNLRKLEQGKIAGVINCLKYDNYKNLIDFIENSNELKFAYRIPFDDGYKEYLKDINIQSLTKTQKQTTGVISESIIFDCLSLWYEAKEVVYTIGPVSNELRWDFQWDSTFYDYDTRSLEFVNEGHVEAPILVEIDGEAENPALSLYVEGELKQTIEFTVDIGENEKFLYGSKATDFYIKKQNSNGTIEDLYEYYDDLVLDFANDNVMRLPKNKSCKLVLSADNEITNAKVTILTYYKAI